MPFDNAALSPLLSAGGFTFWLYRTPDTRAAALAVGYFAPANSLLNTGDLILLQTSDAVTLTPVRAGDLVPPGLVLDTAAAPFRANRAAAPRFSVRQAASAVAMTVLLAPLAAGLVAGRPFEARAAVAGPVAELRFSVRDANGATVRGPLAAPVAGGAAAVTFTAPPAGTGYRLRVEATDIPEVADTSPPFGVSPPFALLLQSGRTLLTQAGGRILL
jgi:hypothetical protein